MSRFFWLAALAGGEGCMIIFCIIAVSWAIDFPVRLWPRWSFEVLSAVVLAVAVGRTYKNRRHESNQYPVIEKKHRAIGWVVGLLLCAFVSALVFWRHYGNAVG
jgi:hypothetical protein